MTWDPVKIRARESLGLGTGSFSPKATAESQEAVAKLAEALDQMRTTKKLQAFVKEAHDAGWRGSIAVNGTKIWSNVLTGQTVYDAPEDSWLERNLLGIFTGALTGFGLLALGGIGTAIGIAGKGLGAVYATGRIAGWWDAPMDGFDIGLSFPATLSLLQPAHDVASWYGAAKQGLQQVESSIDATWRVMKAGHGPPGTWPFLFAP